MSQVKIEITDFSIQDMYFSKGNDSMWGINATVHLYDKEGVFVSTKDIAYPGDFTPTRELNDVFRKVILEMDSIIESLHQ